MPLGKSQSLGRAIEAGFAPGAILSRLSLFQILAG